LKNFAILLICAVLLSACHESIPPASEPEQTTATPTETASAPTEPTTIPRARLPRNDDDEDFDPDNFFTRGGNEWELHLHRGRSAHISWFAPVGEFERLRHEDIYSTPHDEQGKLDELIFFCAELAFNMSVLPDSPAFRSMTDFNKLKTTTKPEEWLIYYYIGLYSAVSRQFDLNFVGNMDLFREKAEYIFGITNIDYDEMLATNLVNGRYTPPDRHTENTIEMPGTCAYGGLLAARVEFSELSKTGAEIVLRYYADSAYWFLAEKMRYVIEFDDEGYRLVSQESLFSSEVYEAARYR
jgi:hypothetical protein